MWGIYLIQADGTSEPFPLTVHLRGEYWSAWSPDGRQLAFSSSRESQADEKASALYVVDTDGSSLRRLTDLVALDTNPAWSPDGQRIAFQSNREAGNWDIYLINRDGTGLTRLTDDEAGDSSPAWSQDGERITFDSDRSGGWQIHMLSLGDHSLRQLTDTSTNGMTAWAPDGATIAFVSFRTGNAEVFSMRPDGTEVKQLTDNPAEDTYPTWSPDGKYIAFSSDRTGNLDVYVMRADGSRVSQLTHDPGDDYPPRWSPADADPGDQPRFGTPYCLRDSDGDGTPDTASTTFPTSDANILVSFPFANMPADLPWVAALVTEDDERAEFSETWSEAPSGVKTIAFPMNLTRSFKIDASGIHGVGIRTDPLEPGAITIQLAIDGRLVQEIKCEVIGP